MSTQNYKKHLGTALCIFFGMPVLTYLLNLCFLPTFSLTVVAVIQMMFLIGCVGSMFYAAIIKDNFNHSRGRIAAFIAAAIYGLLCISNMVFLLESNIRILGFLDDVHSVLIFNTIMFVLIGVFLFSSKAWLPVKIVGSLSYFFAIIYSFLLIVVFNVYYMDNNMILFTTICSYLILFIDFVALILTIIWMAKRSRTPEVQNKEIDLI